MKKCLSVTVILFICGCLTALRQDNVLIINADQPQSKMSKHIYSQFSEHRGTGVYEDIWVEDDPGVPEHRGYKTDVLDVPQDLQIQNIRGVIPLLCAYRQNPL